MTFRRYLLNRPIRFVRIQNAGRFSLTIGSGGSQIFAAHCLARIIAEILVFNQKYGANPELNEALGYREEYNKLAEN
ncbi:hypothetical protein ZHAS_00004558 [Anopheles sinensis]|uniref:Uncharacterized protein n=1 Tax=Anopheles sinensis TaxID=74873 RepID=A0A084VHI1_ANOSI|nr:hypothetical protein ZHAS_00004558 [Anopheles sinensis]